MKFDDVTGKIADGGDGTLQLSYGGGYGVLTLAFFRSAQEAADTEDGYSAWVRDSDPRMPWAGLKVRRRGNVFMAWYRDPPPATKSQIDACLNAARDHSIS